MSRSYKKVPRSGDNKNRFMKKYANRVLRRDENTYQHKSYKKRFCSYNICDYNSVYYDFEDWYRMRVRQWERWGQGPYPDRKEEYRKWYKYYKRK